MNTVKTAAAVVAVCVLMTSSADSQGSSSLYVSTAGSDSNPGTIAQPFRTIKRGMRAVRPGDVLYIRSGVYTEHLVENDFAVSGSSSAWITVTGYPGESVTIRNAGAGEIIRFQDGSRHHIEFRDVILDGSSHNAGHGAVVMGYPGCCGDGSISHDLKFTNVEIRDAWENGIIGGGSNHQFVNMRVHRNGRIPPEVYVQGANAVYFTGDNSVFEGGDTPTTSAGESASSTAISGTAPPATSSRASKSTATAWARDWAGPRDAAPAAEGSSSATRTTLC